MLRVALVGDSDRGDFKLQVVRRILGALDVGTLGAIREHAAVPATAVRNVFVGFRTLVCKRWLLFTGVSRQGNPEATLCICHTVFVSGVYMYIVYVQSDA